MTQRKTVHSPPQYYSFVPHVKKSVRVKESISSWPHKPRWGVTKIFAVIDARRNRPVYMGGGKGRRTEGALLGSCCIQSTAVWFVEVESRANAAWSHKFMPLFPQLMIRHSLVYLDHIEYLLLHRSIGELVYGCLCTLFGEWVACLVAGRSIDRSAGCYVCGAAEWILLVLPRGSYWCRLSLWYSHCSLDCSQIQLFNASLMALNRPHR